MQEHDGCSGRGREAFKSLEHVLPGYVARIVTVTVPDPPLVDRYGECMQVELARNAHVLPEDCVTLSRPDTQINKWSVVPYEMTRL